MSHVARLRSSERACTLLVIYLDFAATWHASHAAADEMRVTRGALQSVKTLPRVGASGKAASSARQAPLAAIIGGVVGAVLVVAVGAGCFLWHRHKESPWRAATLGKGCDASVVRCPRRGSIGLCTAAVSLYTRSVCQYVACMSVPLR